MSEAFVCKFDRLVREMEEARLELDVMPQDQELSQEDLVTLDDLRHAAQLMADTIEAIIEEFQGKK